MRSNEGNISVVDEAMRIKEEWDRKQEPVFVDTAGRGAAVYEVLRRMGVPAQAVHKCQTR